MTPIHPAVAKHLAALEAEGTPWALAKRDAFLAIVEAFADEDGLPRAAGLRQIERGHFDARLGPEWRPAFIEVYQQWLGVLLEMDARPRLFTLAWWLAGPAFLERRFGQGISVLLSPALVAAALCAPLVLKASDRALEWRHLSRELDLAARAAESASATARARHDQAMPLLRGDLSNRDIEALLAASGQIQDAERELKRACGAAAELAALARGVTPEPPAWLVRLLGPAP